MVLGLYKHTDDRNLHETSNIVTKMLESIHALAKILCRFTCKQTVCLYSYYIVNMISINLMNIKQDGYLVLLNIVLEKIIWEFKFFLVEFVGKP